jgi:hypothetical protein
VTFFQVRDRLKWDGANCRCVATPIYYKDWAKLKANGARIAEGYAEPMPAAEHVRVALPPEVKAQLPVLLKPANTLQDLTETESGREWLRSNKAEVRAAMMPPKPIGEAVPDTLPIPEPAKSKLSPMDIVTEAVRAAGGERGRLAPMVKVRAELLARGLTTRAAQDAAIRAARGKTITGTGLEGRFGLTEIELANAFRDEEDRIGWLSLRENRQPYPPPVRLTELAAYPMDYNPEFVEFY